MKRLLLILALLISLSPSFAQTDKDDRDDRREAQRQKKQDRDDDRDDRKDEREQRKQDAKEKKQDAKDLKKDAKDEKDEAKGERKAASAAKVDYNLFRRQMLALNEFTLERHHAADLQRSSKSLIRAVAWVDSVADADESKVLIGYISIVAGGNVTNLYEITFDRATKKIANVRGTGERVEAEPADKPQPRSAATSRTPAAKPAGSRPATTTKPAKDSDDEDENSEEDTDDDSDDEDGKKAKPIKKDQSRQRRPNDDD